MTVQKPVYLLVVMTETPLMSVSEYARRLSVTEQTVRKWAREGRIPAVRVGPRLWRIDGDVGLSTMPNSRRGSRPTTGRLR
jgi:excisionase family DNA binding protein